MFGQSRRWEGKSVQEKQHGQLESLKHSCGGLLWAASSWHTPSVLGSDRAPVQAPRAAEQWEDTGSCKVLLKVRPSIPCLELQAWDHAILSFLLLQATSEGDCGPGSQKGGSGDFWHFSLGWASHAGQMANCPLPF